MRGIHWLSVDSPPQRVSNMEFWCFLCWRLKRAVEQIVNLPVIWDTMTLMWHHCNAEPFTLEQGSNLCPLLYFPRTSIPVRNIGEHIHLKMNDFGTTICHDDILSHFCNETLIIIHDTLKQQLFLDWFMSGTNYDFNGFEYIALCVWNTCWSDNLKWITYQ